MKRVLFDGTACQFEDKEMSRGGSEYGKHMLKAALDHGCNFDVVLFNGYYTPDDVAEILLRCPTNRIKYVDDVLDLYNLIDKGGYDVFFTSNPYPFIDYPCNTRMICVIRSLKRLEMPLTPGSWRNDKKLSHKFFGWLCPRLFAKMLRKQKMLMLNTFVSMPQIKFITISEHIKYSLLNFFPSLQARNIRVFYPQITTNNLYAGDVTGNYFLMVNADKQEKNIGMAVEVFDRLFEEGRLPNKHVIVTGCPAEGLGVKIKHKDKFLFLPYVQKDMIQKFYREAFCMVYPSLNEGFGQAPIKAMACGVPVIASAATSISEVCGPAAMYFVPTSKDDLANRILQVTLNEWLYKKMKDDGLRRVDYLLEKSRRETEQCIKFIFY